MMFLLILLWWVLCFYFQRLLIWHSCFNTALDLHFKLNPYHIQFPEKFRCARDILIKAVWFITNLWRSIQLNMFTGQRVWYRNPGITSLACSTYSTAWSWAMAQVCTLQTSSGYLGSVSSYCSSITREDRGSRGWWISGWGGYSDPKFGLLDGSVFLLLTSIFFKLIQCYTEQQAQVP